MSVDNARRPILIKFIKIISESLDSAPNCISFFAVRFSFLEVSFRFENHLSHYIMQIVLPTMAIIAIVYLNLWMKPDGSPGRFLLTILTFICLVTIYNSNRDKLPALAYANVSSLKPFLALLFVEAALDSLMVAH